MIKIRKFYLKLGTLEQAQIVVSTIVVVSMITIVLVRKLSGHQLGWFDFTSVIIVGIFGFMIGFFTLKYGRLLEEQKQELVALKTVADSVNRAIDIDQLLSIAVTQIKRLLEVSDINVYLVENDRLVLKSRSGDGKCSNLLPHSTLVNDPQYGWIRHPRLFPSPNKKKDNIYASVPLWMKESFVGVLLTSAGENDKLDEKTIDLLSAIANQIGVALENAFLFDRVFRSEEQYIDLFEHAPDMYHIVNSDGTIISCNQTEADRLGYEKAELINQSILKLYPQNFHREVLDLIDQAFRQGRALKDIEEQFITKSGDILSISSNASIINDDSQKPLLLRFASRDISEKKKLEAKVFQSQRIDSIGNLAGGIAHDFNNILTSILGSVAIIKRKTKKGAPLESLIGVIETASRRGAGLTRQLLTFARKEKTPHKPIAVNDVIDETIDLFERSTTTAIVVERKLTDETAIVSGDDGQIQQALLNLMINARDAMPDGGLLTIESKIQKPTMDPLFDGHEGSYVVISVRDTGIGIPPEIQPRIFEPFFSTKNFGFGTGLGLSVVYGVVRAHNGQVIFKTELGKGTVFYLYFPLLREDGIVSTMLKKKRVYRGSGNVIILDDELEVGLTIARMCKIIGYRPSYVRTPKEAFKLLTSGRFKGCPVILDLKMPEMSGTDFYRQMKEKYPTQPIIISTGYDEGLASLQTSPTPDGFLQKPYQLEELSQMLHNVSRKRKKISRTK
jgi:PAS domain S-box-containing protein